MARIKLITDSTVDLPQEIYQRYGITVLPMLINFGEEGYRDGIDITPEEFYTKLIAYDGFPTTAQITPGVFTKVYEEFAKEYEIIISIHLSGKLSGTVDSARLAAQSIENAQVIVYDSESASLGSGFQVLEAARAIEEGCDLPEILRRMDHVKATTSIYFSVPSLEHLQKGGRIGKASAFIGGLLNIVPLLAISEGVVAPFEKIRGRKRVVSRMVELLGERVEEWGKENLNVSVLHTVNPEGARELVEQYQSAFGVEEILVTQLGPAIGTHTGPGVIATVFYKKIN